MSERPEISITVHGEVATGKSAVALAILDALRSCGLSCVWDDEQSERNLGTGAQDIAALESRPTIRLFETNPGMMGVDAMTSALDTIRREVERATAKFPTWPDDPLHAVAVVGEEAGELTKAVLQAVYEPHKSGPVEAFDEAVQTAAMAVRFIMSHGRYRWAGGPQHTQAQAAVTGDGAGEALPDMATLPRIASPIAPMGEEDDEYMPVTDPAALASALVEISHALECTPTLEDMLHAVDNLRERVARTIDRRLEVVITTTLGCDSTPTAIAEALRALVDRAGPDPAHG